MVTNNEREGGSSSSSEWGIGIKRQTVPQVIGGVEMGKKRHVFCKRPLWDTNRTA